MFNIRQPTRIYMIKLSISMLESIKVSNEKLKIAESLNMHSQNLILNSVNLKLKVKK